MLKNRQGLSGVRGLLAAVVDQTVRDMTSPAAGRADLISAWRFYRSPLYEDFVSALDIDPAVVPVPLCELVPADLLAITKRMYGSEDEAKNKEPVLSRSG